MEEKCIRLILDENSGLPNVYFVETENGQGQSINIGKRSIEDGLTVLKIRWSDFKKHAS